MHAIALLKEKSCPIQFKTTKP